MRIIFLLFTITYALLLGGCNNPLNRTYSAATCEQDIQDIRQSDKVSDEDIILLAKYMAISRLSGNSNEGKTYEEMLDDIKKIRQSGIDNADQQKNSELVKRQHLQPFLNVALIEKKFSKVNNKDCMIYTISFQNTSTESITTIVGNIRLDDLMEKEIKKIDILLDQDLKPNAILKKTYTLRYDHSNDKDQRIRLKDLADIKVEWNPDKIIFENGRLAE